MVTVITLLVATNSALAQIEDVGEAMCGTGLGELVVFALALFAVVFILKAAFMMMFAFDKFNSPREQEHLEGTKKMTSAAWTFGAAFVPLLFGAVLDVLGINTISCVDFDIGIFGMAFDLVTFAPLF